MPKKVINLIDVQGEFELKKREAEISFKKIVCPRNCRGRVQNKGKCDPYNCIKLVKGNPAVGIIKEMAGERQASKIKRLKKRDRKILSSISNEFDHRQNGHKLINRQLRSVGLPGKRLSLPKPKDVAQINEIRRRLGLAPLASKCHRCGSPKIRRYGPDERKAKQADYICYTCGHQGITI
jgi:hypothetical protein